MNAPQEIKETAPHAYTWTEPKFVRSESGSLIYETIGTSNAGGCQHTIYFPVDPKGRVLHAQEKWENLALDAVAAVKNKTFRRDLFQTSH